MGLKGGRKGEDEVMIGEVILIDIDKMEIGIPKDSAQDIAFLQE